MRLDMGLLNVAGWMYGGPHEEMGDELLIANGPYPDIHVNVTSQRKVINIWTYTEHPRGVKVIKHFSLEEIAMINAFVHMEGWL